MKQSSKPKHTPGPWEVFKPKGKSNRGVGPSADVIVARALPCFYRGVHHAIANARLIAAAPDLLDALKALKLECLADVLNPCFDNRPTDKPGLHWGSTETEPIAACSSCVARAAIAKAEGRS